MIDLTLWRARIGHFCCVMNSARNAVRAKQVGGSDSPVVSLRDCVTVYLLCMFGVLLVWSLKTNIEMMLDVRSVLLEGGDGDGVTTPCVSELGRDSVSGGVHTDTTVTGLQVPALVAACVINVVFSARRLLLSGDIEQNPGPTDTTDKHLSDATTEMGATASSLPTDALSKILCAISDLKEEITQQRERQHEQNVSIKNDLVDIKSQLNSVSEKCEEINRRCDRLETDNKRLSDTVSSLTRDMDELFTETTGQGEETNSLKTTVSDLKGEVEKMTEEIDRLEGFSRRDNLRIYGLPQQNPKEDYDTCARIVCDTLNSVDRTRAWTPQEHIARAHRVGQPRDGRTQTMIVKFTHWRDKMFIIRDRQLRSELEKVGVRVANDLTRRQTETVARAKHEGKSAYFVRGKFVIGAKRPDPRSYAEVTAGSAVPEVNNSHMQNVNTGGRPSANDRRDPVFDVNDVSQRGDRAHEQQPTSGAASSPAAKNNSSRSGTSGNARRVTTQQRGMHGYLRGSASRVRSSPHSDGSHRGSPSASASTSARTLRSTTK